MPEDPRRIGDSMRAARRASLRVIDEHAGRWNTALNGLGVAALVALHLFGKLSAEIAGAGVITLCGAWAAVAKARRP